MTQKEIEKILIKIVKEGVRTSANLNKLAIKVEKLGYKLKQKEKKYKNGIY
jgi:CRISPR/Cas system-associated protein Csm6